MDAAATSSRLKRDWPRMPPNYVSLRDLQELRLKEKEQQEWQRQREEEDAAVRRMALKEREQQEWQRQREEEDAAVRRVALKEKEQQEWQRKREEEAAAVHRVVEEAAPAPARKTEVRGSSEKSWGASEGSRGRKKWAARAPPPPTRAEGAAKKTDGAIGALAAAHRMTPPPTRAESAAKKTDGAIGVSAVADGEAPAPTATEGAAKKRDVVIGGHAVKKGADEAAASAFQGGARPANKGKGKGEVSAGTEQPSAPAETATVSSPGGTPEERKGKGKALGEQGTVSSVTTGAPGEPASASSRGRTEPANRRNRRNGCVDGSAVVTADASPPRVVDPKNKAKWRKKPSRSWGRRAGAAPTSDSSDGKNPHAQPTSPTESGVALGTTGEAKPESLREKQPVLDAKSKGKSARTAPVVKAIGRQRHDARVQLGGVWVPKGGGFRGSAVPRRAEL
ncbi:hypothetical protein GUJ93_ZPchr0013g36297 [Zizania palustris]|uniref:Uncharacterized protein n=1 Tax=Zizania palustris TaxID=103762 RepID=A0A8J5X5E2_ZIZPA|nr:hypothetical protein GUJ93_ZPchr0013g36297 [Zizania palustris]